MRRLPIVPTLIVTAALAAMIALGIWQLRRAEWKDGLLASYRANAGATMVYGLPLDVPVDALAFRRAHILCRITTGATQLGGVNRQGRTGFRNIVGCGLIDGRVIMRACRARDSIESCVDYARVAGALSGRARMTSPGYDREDAIAA